MELSISTFLGYPCLFLFVSLFQINGLEWTGRKILLSSQNMAGIENFVPNLVHIQSTQLGTQMQWSRLF